MQMNYTHRDIVLEEVERFVRQDNPDNILEIGAGMNSFKPIFETFNQKEYTCIDNESQYKGDSIKMDAHSMTFKDKEFDCVFMCHVAEHFEDPIRAFSEIHRVLDKGGKMLSITPNNCEHQILLGDPAHLFVLSPIQYIKLLKHVGFREVTSYVQMTYKGKQIPKVQDYNIITVAIK